MNRRATILLSVMCVGLPLSVGCVQANAALFSSATNFATGATPRSVAIANFNGDSYNDLAVAAEASNAVSILLGDGKGSFGAKTNFTTGAGPRSVKSADFNGDGKADLAVADFGVINKVSVLIGKGDGTFFDKVDYTVGAGVIDLTITDLNGDGKQDIATVNDSDFNVSVLLGVGDGTFGSSTNYAVGMQPVSIASGDLNGDGKPDLVTADDLGDSVSVLINNGSGGFGASVPYPTGTMSMPMSVVMADFTGDGKLDVAAAINGAQVAVLPGAGNGTLGAKVASSSGSNGEVNIAAKDIDEDGKVDLLASANSANTVSFLGGQGNGSFATPVPFATGTGPYGLAVGKLDGKGQSDIAIANGSSNNISVLLGPRAVLEGDFSDLRFSGLTVGNSVSRSLTVTNKGNAATTVISYLGGGAEFSETSNSCKGQLAPGKSCSAVIRFAPTEPGSPSGSFSLFYDDTYLHTSFKGEGLADLGPGRAVSDKNNPVDCPLRDMRCQFLLLSVIEGKIKDKDLIARGVKITVSCSATAVGNSCVTTVSLYGPTDFPTLLKPSAAKKKKAKAKRVLLGKVKFKLAAGKTKKITLKLTKSGKKYIKRLKKNTTLELEAKTKANGKTQTKKKKIKVLVKK